MSGELASWHQASAESQALEKHHTQIRRLTRQLDVHAAEIRARLTRPDVTILADWMDLEQQVLDLHRIWDFFRSKIAQRWVPWLRPYLAVADAFAVACYDPAVDLAVASRWVNPATVREPPLVFLSDLSTPYTVVRGEQAVIGLGHGLPGGPFGDLLRALPIPVIGVPWHQVEHLPDALIIAHEVGHNVFADLRLETTLVALLAEAVPPVRRAAWAAWLPEVFADAYGVLAAGPAFVGALLDFLAGPPEVVRSERRDHTDQYPTVALRALLGLELLDQSGFPSDATLLKRSWRTTYDEHAMPACEQDLGALAAAVLDGPYPQFGGRPLAAALSFGTLAGDAEVDAARLIDRQTDFPPSSADPRALLAACRLAFGRDPDQYQTGRVGPRTLARIIEVQQRGVRFERDFRPDPQDEDLQAHDRAVGTQLSSLTAQLHT